MVPLLRAIHLEEIDCEEGETVFLLISGSSQVV